VRLGLGSGTGDVLGAGDGGAEGAVVGDGDGDAVGLADGDGDAVSPDVSPVGLSVPGAELPAVKV
jgi:hypothetical protein